MDKILNRFGKLNIIITNKNEQINVINVLDFGSNIKKIRDFLKQWNGVYLLHNQINNKIYIGSSIKLWQRCITYFKTGTRRINHKVLYAFKKYGYENIKFYILEIHNPNNCSVKHTRDREQYYIDKYHPFRKNGYNIATSTNGNDHVKKFTKEGMSNIINSHSGENSSLAKLTDDKVMEIKIKLSQNVLLKDIANQYNVSTTVISNIKRNKTWKHIKCDEATENILKLSAAKYKRRTTKEMLFKIRQDLKEKIEPMLIAKKYGLAYSTIMNIKNGHIHSEKIE